MINWLRDGPRGHGVGCGAVAPGCPTAKPSDVGVERRDIRQLGLLRERFAGPEIQILRPSGDHCIQYADTIIGPDLPNLTYLIPFASLAEREKTWVSSAPIPNELRYALESITRGGQIVNYNNISLWRDGVLPHSVRRGARPELADRSELLCPHYA